MGENMVVWMLLQYCVFGHQPRPQCCLADLLLMLSILFYPVLYSSTWTITDISLVPSLFLKESCNPIF